MAPLPVEVLFGIYIGLLTGIIPALIAWALGFVFRYLSGVSVPAFWVVALGVTIAGINGGLLVLTDPTVTQSANASTIVVAVLVVLMMLLVAHSRGDEMGASFPRRISLDRLRERTLSLELADLVGRGQVRIRVAGEVTDMEGYPPLPDPLRTRVRESEWTLPADLPVAELEERLAQRLRTEFDLGDASVSIDERGRATVAAAPPFSGLSKRVQSGRRAVSVDALVPTGLARGDEVRLTVEGAGDDTAGAGTGTGSGSGTADPIHGTVVSARSTALTQRAEPTPEPTDAGADADTGAGDKAGEDAADTTPGDGEAPRPTRAPTTDGGDGQVTVAVERGDADALVRADRAYVVVEARGTRREYELVSLLRRAGRRIERVTIGEGSPLDGVTVGEAGIRDRYGVAVLAVRRDDGWSFSFAGSTRLSAGDEVFAVGTRDAVEGFRGVVA